MQNKMIIYGIFKNRTQNFKILIVIIGQLGKGAIHEE